jgi:predicted RNase H-like nuclease (RuvC/YqgF family)
MRDYEKVTLPSIICKESLLKDLDYFGFQNIKGDNVKGQESVSSFVPKIQKELDECQKMIKSVKTEHINDLQRNEDNVRSHLIQLQTMKIRLEGYRKELEDTKNKLDRMTMMVEDEKTNVRNSINSLEKGLFSVCIATAILWCFGYFLWETFGVTPFLHKAIETMMNL